MCAYQLIHVSANKSRLSEKERSLLDIFLVFGAMNDSVTNQKAGDNHHSCKLKG